MNRVIGLVVINLIFGMLVSCHGKNGSDEQSKVKGCERMHEIIDERISEILRDTVIHDPDFLEYQRETVFKFNQIRAEGNQQCQERTSDYYFRKVFPLEMISLTEEYEMVRNNILAEKDSL